MREIQFRSSFKDFFSKCGLVTFTEEIRNGKLHFLCSEGFLESAKIISDQNVSLYLESVAVDSVFSNVSVDETTINISFNKLSKNNKNIPVLKK